MYALSVTRPLNRFAAAGVCLCYVVIALLSFREYFLWDAGMLMAIVLLPYTCTIERGRFSMRYLAPALLFCTAALFIPVKTGIFLAMLFSILFLAENSIGKTNATVLFLIGLMSPIFRYVSNILGFPIRLWLSEVAASILSFAGSNAHADGNIIRLGNDDFAVDQACTALNMLVTSLVICLFIIAFSRRKINRKLTFMQTVLLLLIAVMFNICCNLLRIVLLVLFKIMPDSIFHDLIGLTCLSVYVILPLLLIIPNFCKHFGKQSSAPPALTSHTLRYPLLHLFLCGAMLWASLNLRKMDDLAPRVTICKIEGYKKTVLDNGIIKLENAEALIYLKPGVFYSPGHDPTICWAGSGYIFKSVKKERICGSVIYTGILEKGHDHIYTAWWFDNGAHKTISQIEWRWKAVKGNDHFYLVNVNARTYGDLKRQIGRLTRSLHTSGTVFDKKKVNPME